MRILGYHIIKSKEVNKYLKTKEELERVFMTMKSKLVLIDEKYKCKNSAATLEECAEFGIVRSSYLSGILSYYKEILKHESI